MTFERKVVAGDLGGHAKATDGLRFASVLLNWEKCQLRRRETRSAWASGFIIAVSEVNVHLDGEQEHQADCACVRGAQEV